MSQAGTARRCLQCPLSTHCGHSEPAAVGRCSLGMILPDHLVEQIYGGSFPVTVWRKHRGWTQHELASRAGMSPSALRAIEQRKRLVEDEAEILAKALGISPCCLRARGRFRGCDEALELLGD